MQSIKKITVLAVVILVATGVSAYVDDGAKVVVGLHEIMTVDVPSDVTWDKPVIVAGVLRKIGAGTLTITGEKLYGPGRIEVSKGALSLTATGAGSAPIPVPTAVMNGAAMWLDANMHIAGPDGSAATDDAAFWFDARETEWATPGFATNYIYAQASTNLSTDSLWPTSGTDGLSRPYIDFGGCSSGQFMVWRTPGGDKAWIPVVHSFFAYNPNGSHGHILGVATSPSENANKVMAFATSSGSDGGTLFFDYNENNLRHLRLGRVFRDGVRADLNTAIDKTVVQLLETETYRPDAYAEAFFNFRNYQQKGGSYSFGNRVGGGRLHEVLVFTNAIPETDRVLVEQYLMRKWVKISGYSIPPSIRVDAGATLTIPDALVSATTIVSDGIVSRPGSTVSLHEGVDLFGCFRGRVVLDPESVASNRINAAVSPEAGKEYAIDSNNTLTVADGEPGAVKKTGDGSLVFEGLGAAEKVSIVNGGVVLRASAPVDEDPIAANCIADGGFEGLWAGTTFQAFNNGSALGSSTAWKVTNHCSSASTRIIYKTGWSPMWQSGKILGTVEGDYYRLLKNGGGVRQTVSLSRPGRYEITLRAYPRSDSTFCAGFLRIFVDDHAVGTVQVRYQEDDWDRIRLVTPYFDAGNHVVTMISETEYDIAIGVDDVRMVWLDDMHDIAIANGNFENIDWSLAPLQPGAGNNAQYATSYAVHTNTVFGVSNGWFPGWTAGGSGKAWGIRRLPYLRSEKGFVGPENDNGSISVLLSNGGMLNQTVTIPETGIYRLSVKAARYYHSTVTDPGSSKLAPATSGSVGKISISVGDTSEEFSFNDWAMAERRLPSPVLLEKDASVAISVMASDISGSVNNIVVDDVRLVMETGNVVNNPGFEGETTGGNKLLPTSWTVVANPENKQLCYVGDSSLVSEAAEGRSRCRLHSGTHIAQDVPLSSGYWRLSFWDVSRIYNGKIGYGPVPVSVTLARGAETNFCATVTPSTNCVNFIRREYLIEIDTAGTYTLGFEAMPSQGDKSSYIDAVCLMPAMDVRPDRLPSVAAKTRIVVDTPAALSLDFDGMLKVDSFLYNGRSLSGEQSSASCLGLLGIGRIFSLPKGMQIKVR